MVKAFKAKQKYIATERVKHLISFADEVFSKDPKRADHYIELARKVAMKARIRIPSNFKKRFCKHCYSFLKPGINCRVRTRNNKVVYYCLNCKKYMRFPFLKEKKLRKKRI